ncbi:MULTISPECIES: hypothetical protein [unclassified Streptomyces]|uniref:hypothetical protein n=1 Tax=unclassified Streptomyces TaxID=2593676 RepID=UPI0003648596|nr:MULTISPECIES: hypothetical protein [unclassified Streptomyces]MYX36509.1 hypothetical protein [Streptomyces sp. SID8377]
MSGSLHEPWLRGIAFNPAAPSEVLVRLLDPAAGDTGLLMCEGRDLPDAVIDAALRHPSGIVDGGLSGFRVLAGQQDLQGQRLPFGPHFVIVPGAAVSTDEARLVQVHLELHDVAGLEGG